MQSSFILSQFFFVFLFLTIISCEFFFNLCILLLENFMSHFPFYISLLRISQLWNEVNDLSLNVFLDILFMFPPPTNKGPRPQWFVLNEFVHVVIEVYKNLSSWPIGGEMSLVWRSSKVGMVYQMFKPYQWQTHINCITSMQVCKKILHHKISGYRLLHKPSYIVTKTLLAFLWVF
jgi:hypothetical protein